MVLVVRSRVSVIVNILGEIYGNLAGKSLSFRRGCGGKDTCSLISHPLPPFSFSPSFHNSTMKNALIIGVSYASSCDAFATTAPSKRRTITALHSSSGRNSPGFVPFSSDDNPIRSSSAPNSRRPMDDPFAPPSASSRGRWQEPNMMYGPAVGQRQSNLSPYSRPSINDADPLYMDVERERYSQRPHPSTMMPHHRQQSQSSWQGMDGRIQVTFIFRYSIRVALNTIAHIFYFQYQ